MRGATRTAWALAGPRFKSRSAAISTVRMPKSRNGYFAAASTCGSTRRWRERKGGARQANSPLLKRMRPSEMRAKSCRRSLVATISTPPRGTYRLIQPPFANMIQRTGKVKASALETRFLRLSDALVALPALILELDQLNRDPGGIGVQFGQRLVLRNPAAEDVVGDRQLTRFVVKLERDVPSEVGERYFGPQATAIVPDFVGPLFELVVMGDAALKCDGVVMRQPRRLAADAWIAPITMLDDFCCPLQRADFADAGNVAPVPLDSKLEVLVGIEASGIYGELCHSALLTSRFD